MGRASSGVVATVVGMDTGTNTVNMDSSSSSSSTGKHKSIRVSNRQVRSIFAGTRLSLLRSLPSRRTRTSVRREFLQLPQAWADRDVLDTVVAASFQMKEAHSGYRQSGDLASKKRVREAINAALTNLPDWPPQNY